MGLVVDTLQPQLFLFLLTAILDQNRSIQMDLLYTNLEQKHNKV